MLLLGNGLIPQRRRPCGCGGQQVAVWNMKSSCGQNAGVPSLPNIFTILDKSLDAVVSGPESARVAARRITVAFPEPLAAGTLWTWEQ